MMADAHKLGRQWPQLARIVVSAEEYNSNKAGQTR
jgi:hypothetical protein